MFFLSPIVLYYSNEFIDSNIVSSLTEGVYIYIYIMNSWLWQESIIENNGFLVVVIVVLQFPCDQINTMIMIVLKLHYFHVYCLCIGYVNFCM